jgi:hypothetical protein
MSRLGLSLAVAALAAGLSCSVALAQSAAPAPDPALQTQTSSEPSTATKLETWTEKEWNAAKQKWSQDKAKCDACNQDAKDQKLSGRKIWSYLYDCMNNLIGGSRDLRYGRPAERHAWRVLFRSVFPFTRDARFQRFNLPSFRVSISNHVTLGARV